MEIVYTDSEAELIERTSRAASLGVSAIVSNTGSFCYASYSIRDCFSTMKIPVVEVHMSNQLAPGIQSVTGAGAKGIVMDFGHDSYLIAVDAAVGLAQATRSIAR